MKWRWSMESCSHFKHHLFIRPLCATSTFTHAAIEILQFIPSRTSDQTHSLPPSSPKIDGVFCHPMLHVVQYSSKEKSSSHTQWIFINSAWRWLVNEGQQAWHTSMYRYTHTHQQPHYPSFRHELCFVPLESDSDLWRRGVTLHPDTHRVTKQGYRPKHGHKERLLHYQQSHTDSSARCGPGSTPHQCSLTNEFSQLTKWMHWLLSITCFDDFHEYESPSLNDFLMIYLENHVRLRKKHSCLSISHCFQLFMPVSGVIFCCITTVVLSKRWP